MHSGQILCPADGSFSPDWAQVSSPSPPLVLCEAAAFILTHFADGESTGSAATSPKNLICYNFLPFFREAQFH